MGGEPVFQDFLFLLRKNGLKVSLVEWTSLMEALQKGLHQSSLTGFYFLCRALLVKSEADFDCFDRTFLEYFENIPWEGEISQELMDWLETKGVPEGLFDELQSELNWQLPEQDIEAMFQQRMQEQHEQHHGGSYWIGTRGMSVFGHSGLAPKGIRVGGQSKYRSAIRVAGERRFRDFRQDNTLDSRQFQVALRRLRQYSGLLNLSATEFDVDNTIQQTANNAGVLQIRYKKPRRNTVKVLLLIDSGGSMDYYSRLVLMLFQAVNKTYFHDLQIYYFHNCVYSRLYTDPTLDYRQSVQTDWVLSNYGGDYKVIFVGDAQMAPYELLGKYHRSEAGKPATGYEWLSLLRDRYRYSIWLNPSERPDWGEYWSKTHDTIAHLFPMFPLTVDGLTAGMQRLLATSQPAAPK